MLYLRIMSKASAQTNIRKEWIKFSLMEVVWISRKIGKKILANCQRVAKINYQTIN